MTVKVSHGVLLGWLRMTLLIFLDTLMLSIAWLTAKALGTPIPGFHLLWSPQQEPGLLLPILAVSLGTLASAGLYGTDDKRRSFPSLIEAITLSQIILLITAYLYEPRVWVSRSVFLFAWFLSLILVCAERLTLHLVITHLRQRHTAFRQPIFLLGYPEDVEKAEQLLDISGQFNVMGVVDLAVRKDPKQWTKALEEMCSQRISEVFICSWQFVEDPTILFWQLRACGLQLRILPVSLELPRQWSEIKMIGGVTTIRFNSPPIIGSDFWLKRGFDITMSFLILLLVSLPCLLIAVLIKLDSPGSVLYQQTRVGLKGQHFKVLKFRTMVANAGQFQQELEAQNEVKGGVLFKIKHDPRITRIGKFLRQYSLDELPQLLNVLRGDMSLVGPRPLPVRDVERFSEHHHLRHEILPGITGLWQVSGRSDLDSEDIFYLDMAYMQHWSLALDCKILLQTVRVLVSKEGAY
ncbi:sugar transferase [Leptolyngbya sp. FACHB-261]|uniref:sugar transferase n=1 Tax=Leptolyngbya sp. FACHB-261 TaxID=2692806 RepID=UPI0018F011E2|nr:sugar transferase [Leptolyngbya sp. FACHB-261]